LLHQAKSKKLTGFISVDFEISNRHSRELAESSRDTGVKVYGMRDTSVRSYRNAVERGGQMPPVARHQSWVGVSIRRTEGRRF